MTSPVISGLNPEVLNHNQRNRRITFHSPLQGLHGYQTADFQTEGPMDFLSKLPARFLSGKSSIEFQHPPEIKRDEAIVNPVEKQNESSTKQWEATLDPESPAFDPDEMKKVNL